MDRYKVLAKLIDIADGKDVGHAEFSAGVILINFLDEKNINEEGEILNLELEDKISSVQSCLETAYGVSKGHFDFETPMRSLKTAVNDLSIYIHREQVEEENLLSS